jgi:hypothetical protein
MMFLGRNGQLFAICRISAVVNYMFRQVFDFPQKLVVGMEYT